MSAVGIEESPRRGGLGRRSHWGTAVMIAIGLAALYLPTYWTAANTIWQSEDNAHGALVLIIVAWLFWSQREQITGAPVRPVLLGGALVFALGLVMYIYSRALENRTIEFSSPIFVITGALLVLRGRAALKAAWFPIVYMLFSIPLPSILVDSLTGPLKAGISESVEYILHAAGYPVARSGVVLYVGQYQLLVADACSGLHSLFSLAAIGTLFMYLKDRSSKLHNIVMLLSIVPIALAVNAVRVIILILITYYFGDEAGQGYLHGMAGLLLMLFALAAFFLLDAALSRIWCGRLSADGKER